MVSRMSEGSLNKRTQYKNKDKLSTPSLFEVNNGVPREYTTLILWILVFNAFAAKNPK